MTEQPIPTEKEHSTKKVVVKGGGGSDSVYGLGLIGAWMFYFKRATTTEEKVKAFFKGLVWPVFLVYELFTFLNKDSQES